MNLRFALLAAVVACAGAGCTKDNPAFCNDNSECTDPAAPFCDVDGEFGDRNHCVANPLDAGVPTFDASPLPDGNATLSIDLSGSGTGSVQSSPSGIDCGATCDAEFAQGTEVTLSPAASSGTTFVTWSGDCPRGFGDCAVTMSSDKNVTATFGLTGEHLFSAGHGAAGDDTAQDVAFDRDGNFAVAGSFTGMVDFGDGNPVSAADARDGFVAKYDTDGTLAWVVPFGGTGDDTIYSVAFDPNGDVYATGSLDEAPATAYPMLIVKLDGADGGESWRKEIEGTGATVPAAIAANGTHVVSVGYFTGIVDFGGGDVMGRGVDGFLVWHTIGGNFVRAIRIQAVLPDLAFEFTNDVAIDSSGNVIIAGTTNGTTFDIGGGSLPKVGNNDFYVAKYSSAGAHQWSKRYGGSDTVTADSVAVDADGNVYVTGAFVDDADFGDGTVTANTGAIGGQDAFVASYGGDTGSYRWANHYGGTNGTNRGLGVAASPRGTVAAVGTFDATVNFGDGGIASQGDTDIYFATVEAPTGDPVRSARFGASDDDAMTSPDEVTAVAIDDVGRVAIVGFTANTLSFGGAAVASIGGTDFFVAVFGP